MFLDRVEPPLVELVGKALDVPRDLLDFQVDRMVRGLDRLHKTGGEFQILDTLVHHALILMGQ